MERYTYAPKIDMPISGTGVTAPKVPRAQRLISEITPNRQNLVNTFNKKVVAMQREY